MLPNAPQITAGGLDSMLMEVEPIFRDGSFTMPSFQEVLTARQFAEEINSGRLSVRDAYEQFWSYEEDAGLWGLPKDREWKALLPSWKPVILQLSFLLDYEKLKHLSSTFYQNYESASKCLDRNDYNPFLSDLFFSGEIIAKFSKRNNTDLAMTIGQELGKWSLVNGPNYFYVTNILWRLSGGRPEKFIDYLPHKAGYEWEALGATHDDKAVDYIIKRVKGPKALGRCFQLDALGILGTAKACDFLIRYCQNVENEERYSAYRALAAIGSDKAIRFLLQIAMDVDHPDHHPSMHGLLHMDNEYARIKFIEIMLSHPNKYRGFSVTGEIGSKEFIDPLIENVGRSSKEGRNYSIISLGILRDKGAVDCLVSYLANPGDNVDEFSRSPANNGTIEWAIWALGEIGGEKASKALVRELHHLRLDCGLVEKALVKASRDSTLEQIWEVLEKNGYVSRFLYGPIERIIEQRISPFDLKSLWKSLSLVLQYLRNRDYSDRRSTYPTIYSIHQHLKPRGYNPPIKRLAT